MKSIRLLNLKSHAIGNSAIDIGTDHGYLLLSLFKDGFTKLLAIEKNKGPYDNCLHTIKQNNMENITGILLSDGMQKISKQEAYEYDNIIIAGMGGDLITSIIHQDLEKFYKSRLILQPNNNGYKLRKYLNDNKFKIIDEDIVLENDKIYEIIICNYSTNNQTLSEEELMFGLEKNYTKEAFSIKWEEELKHLKNIQKVLEKNKKQKDSNINLKIQMINNIRRKYEIR